MSKKTEPAQQQDHQPGQQWQMHPQPAPIRSDYRGSGKLQHKVALITGGDSGIGRSVGLYFAREGAHVAVVYLEESNDAQETRQMIEAEGRQCLLIQGDIADAVFCQQAVDQTVSKLGRLDILVNNAAEQHPTESIEKISDQQLLRTFQTNIFSMFYLVKAALPHLANQQGSSIINTTSVTAYRGSAKLLDYSATKGAIVSFTRSLSQSLVQQGIRVNGVAPGPIWTPLIPSTFGEEKVETFGSDTPMQRPGQPAECAGAYVFLASDEASYITGQVIHVNGGEVING